MDNLSFFAKLLLASDGTDKLMVEGIQSWFDSFKALDNAYEVEPKHWFELGDKGTSIRRLTLGGAVVGTYNEYNGDSHEDEHLLPYADLETKELRWVIEQLMNEND